MAAEFKYKHGEELLELIPGTPSGKLFTDDDEVFSGPEAPLGARLGEPKNGNGTARA